MEKRKEIVFKGVAYKSLASLAREYTISPSTLYNRIKRGYSLEDSLCEDFLTEHGKQGRRFNIEGTTYNSMLDLSHDMFLNASTLKSRLDSGYTVEQAIDPDFSTKYDKRKTGRTPDETKNRVKSSQFDKSLAQLGRDFGLSPETLRARLNGGYTLEQASDPDFLDKYAKNKTSVTVHGVRYKSVRDFCRIKNLNHSTVKYRLKKGYTLEQISDPDFSEKYDTSLNNSLEADKLRQEGHTIKGVGKTVTFEGQLYKSYSSLAKGHNMTGSTLINRLNRGYTLEQALDPEFSTKYAKRKRDRQK